MEIKDNELIVTFLEEDNFVNTFTFFAEEDSGEFLTDIYHDFMNGVVGWTKTLKVSSIIAVCGLSSRKILTNKQVRHDINT